MPDASPTKWHRAHVTWFFEQFLLRPFDPAYRAFDERFGFLFNSYYVAAGPRQARPQRGLITRPASPKSPAYRAHVDAAVAALIETRRSNFANASRDHRDRPASRTAASGIAAHRHPARLFAQNATHPAYDPDWQWPRGRALARLRRMRSLAGIHMIGHDGEGFCFDNEQPAHQVAAAAGAALAVRWSPTASGSNSWPTAATRRRRLWLSDGWATVEAQGWNAPGYWRKIDGAWFAMTLGGLRPVDPALPVCHVSYYEADAFARWAGKHLPTEARMGGRGKSRRARRRLRHGLAMDAQRLFALSGLSKPRPARSASTTASSWSTRWCCAARRWRRRPAIRARRYRNFFYPPARWQFTGLRLAEYEH